MNIRKEAKFLADCLAHMPSQHAAIAAAVDTSISGLTLIADGGDWPRGEALAARAAASRAADRAAADGAADRAASRAAAWAATWAAMAAATRAADWAAEAHPDPAKERARQAKVREKLGLNTEGA